MSVISVRLENGLIDRRDYLSVAYSHSTKNAYRAQQKRFARKMKCHVVHGQSAHRIVIAAIKKGLKKITDLCNVQEIIQHKTFHLWKSLAGDKIEKYYHATFYAKSA